MDEDELVKVVYNKKMERKIHLSYPKSIYYPLRRRKIENISGLMTCSERLEGIE